MSLGKVLNSLRNQAGFSALGASDALKGQGVSLTSQAIRNIERGLTKRPPLTTITALFKLYGVDEASAAKYYNDAYGDSAMPETLPDKDSVVSNIHVAPAIDIVTRAGIRDRLVRDVVQVLDDYHLRDSLRDKPSYLLVVKSIEHAVEAALEVLR